jgi:demethylmenaquinone methyltransferase/2-methoxy-6-polyprenyl-1,4-benzoquinol methylase
MTWGQDVHWRWEVIDRTQLPQGGSLLDIGAGTGDLALEASRRDHTLWVVAADFTPEMIRVGRARDIQGTIDWVCCDAEKLPCPAGSFDAVVSGYLLRNVSNIQTVLGEQYRVLKPGGRMVCLDTTPPLRDLWHLPVRLYIKWVIPFIGARTAGDREAYRYLADSTERFLTASALAECIKKVGFREVGFRRFMGESMAIHWAMK